MRLAHTGLTVEWLQKYAPELNDIERVWHDLKAFHLAHQTLSDTDVFDQAIHPAVSQPNTERMTLSLAEPARGPARGSLIPWAGVGSNG